MLEFLKDGGPFMIPLGICAVLAVAVLIERALVLKEVKAFVGPFLDKFDDLIQSGKLAEAQNLCEKHRHPVSRMLKAGLVRYQEVRQEENVGFIHEQIDDAVSDAGSHAISLLEKRLDWLAIISNLGPLLGFTGTVTGMIVAFGAIASAATVDVSKVAGGISQALNTTASGLVIGIIATVAYNYYTSRIEDFIEQLEEASNRMLAHIVRELIHVRYGEEGKKTSGQKSKPKPPKPPIPGGESS